MALRRRRFWIPPNLPPARGVAQIVDESSGSLPAERGGGVVGGGRVRQHSSGEHRGVEVGKQRGPVPIWCGSSAGACAVQQLAGACGRNPPVPPGAARADPENHNPPTFGADVYPIGRQGQAAAGAPASHKGFPPSQREPSSQNGTDGVRVPKGRSAAGANGGGVRRMGNGGPARLCAATRQVGEFSTGRRSGRPS